MFFLYQKFSCKQRKFHFWYKWKQHYGPYKYQIAALKNELNLIDSHFYLAKIWCSFYKLFQRIVMETYLVLILLTSNIITEVNMVQFYSYFLKLKIELVSLQTCVNIHTDYNFEETFQILSIFF